MHPTVEVKKITIIHFSEKTFFIYFFSTAVLIFGGEIERRHCYSGGR